MIVVMECDDCDAKLLSECEGEAADERAKVAAYWDCARDLRKHGWQISKYVTLCPQCNCAHQRSFLDRKVGSLLR